MFNVGKLSCKGGSFGYLFVLLSCQKILIDKRGFSIPLSEICV